MVRDLILAARLARRELRAGGSLRGLRIVLACLALGVAAVAGVGSLRAGIERGLAADGSRILGGDLEVEGGSQPLPDSLRTWLRERGAGVSDVVSMRSMLIAPSGERLLVELKAVDPAWPLVGSATYAPAQASADAFARRDGMSGLAAEPVILDRLHLKPGDTARLGRETFAVRATLTGEPDRVSSAALFGSHVLISTAALADTGLIEPGSIVDYHLRALLAPGADVGRTVADLRAAFPGQGWRLRDVRNAVPGMLRFINQTGLFMTLVGLTSLLVGGIGVANGVRAWLDARARSIATLRCLGASARLVFLVCLFEVAALCGLGVLLGVAVGAALPAFTANLLRDLLPVPLAVGVFPGPLALAAAYGLLTAAAFALGPLARAMRIPGAALFRDPLTPAPVRPPAWLLGVNAAAAAGLIVLTVASAADRRFALGFCAAVIGTLMLFRAGGWLLMRLASRAPHGGRAWARLGLGNLHRPGTSTPLMLTSIGLGLSTLASVALIEGNLRREVMEQLPQDAPSFFFVDIQDQQLEPFRRILAGQPGVREVHEVPSLRARVVAVNGMPADQVKATPDTAWALRGDRGLTYSAAEPKDTRLVEGHWWPADYQGPPLVSFDASLARGWGVGVGDTLRVNVLGRDIDLRIASLRDIAWRSLGINFTLVASPGLLAQAPHTHIATVRADDAAQATVLRAVTDALPNVSGIRVTDVLSAIAVLVGKLGAALAATGALTLAAGALVLAGAVAAGQRRRIQAAVILKALGATRAQIRAAWLVEFGVLGLAAGLIASAVGTAASFGVMRFVMAADWAFLPGTLVTTVTFCILVMLAFGYAGIAAALRAKVAPVLRND